MAEQVDSKEVDENLPSEMVNTSGDLGLVDYRQDWSLTKALIDESEKCRLCQSMLFPIDCVRILLKNPNTQEKLGGWLETGEVKNVKKKKTRRRSADDALYLPFNDYESHQQRSQLKSADDGWRNGQVKKPLPFWKTVVETDTYRYIPNNGQYRIEKTVAKVAPIRPKKQERVYLTTEQRALQKEIQRDLRRELEHQQLDNTNMGDAINELENNMNNGPVKLQYSHGESRKIADGALEQEITTNNARNKNSTRLQGLSQQYTPTLELPPITNQGKSYLDPFMEQVSKKLSALEEEMKRDSSIRMSSRRSFDDHSGHTKSDTKGNRKIEQHRADGITPDMFSVKQIMKNNEKKLKAKSIQIQSKNLDKTSFSLPSHVRYTTANGDVISIPLFSNVHAPNTTSLIDQERQSFRNSMDTNGHLPPNNPLENTLQTVKCKVKRDQHNGRSHNKRKHSTSNVDAASKAINNAFPNVHTTDSLSAHLLNTEDSYPDLLPKVSGKRLEVPITTNR